MNRLLICIIALLIFGNNAHGQFDEIHFIPEAANQIDTSVQWFAVTNQLNITRAHPYIKYIVDEESGFTGNMIVEDQYPILIFRFAGHFKQDTTTEYQLVDTIDYLTSGKRIEVEENIYLYGRTQFMDGDSIFSIFVKDTFSQIHSEIFRNCRIITDINNYFGCGRIPIGIEFVGNIVNDKSPEILLIADKEGGVLRVLIGKINNKYQVIKWTSYNQ